MNNAEGQMKNLTNSLQKIGIIPVVVLDDAEKADSLSDALVSGGIPCAEITFRTAAAPEAIHRMIERHPDMLVGAGTVLTPEQVVTAKQTGAQFIVSPGFNPNVVKKALEENIPMIPGCQTPSEMEGIMELGIHVAKFFPAEPSGGLDMLKAVGAAYVDLYFMPTGGLNAENVRDYLAWDRIIACGGSWMVKNNLINDEKFDEIEKLVREAAQIVREIRK